MTKTTNNWENYKDAIELGMTDGDATRAVCAEYVKRMRGRTSELVDLRNENNEYCDEKGRAITDEPPLCVLGNLDAARTVRVNLRNDVTLVKTLIDWDEVDANDLASCVLQDGWLENDEIPTEFVATDEDGEPRNIDDDKRRLIETVLWAISDDANSQREEYLKIRTTDPVEIEGDRFDDVWKEYEEYCYTTTESVVVRWSARFNLGFESKELVYLEDRQRWYSIEKDGTLSPQVGDDPDLPSQATEYWCEIEELDDEKTEEYLATLEEDEE